jgi:hypothetical protein
LVLFLDLALQRELLILLMHELLDGFHGTRSSSCRRRHCFCGVVHMRSLEVDIHLCFDARRIRMVRGRHRDGESRSCRRRR